MKSLHCILAFTLGICLCRFAQAGKGGAQTHVETGKVQHSVERAIEYLQAESGSWVKQGRCASCHHVAMPLWALNEAGSQGYIVDRDFLNHIADVALGSPQKMIAAGIAENPAKPDPRPMGRGVNVGAVFMAVAARPSPTLAQGPEQCLKLIADDIVRKQQPDGSWEFFLSRPPINQSQTTDAAWIIMVLQGEAGPDTPESHRKALQKGLAWLNSSGEPDGQEVTALKLLVAIRAGAPHATIDAACEHLLKLQQADGAWSQLSDGKGDAFATGQTLYVLALAGHTAHDPAIERAINFLITTQKADGSWAMTSRASPDGRPGGSAKNLKPITCGAAAWATMGLARLVPQSQHRD